MEDIISLNFNELGKEAKLALASDKSVSSEVLTKLSYESDIEILSAVARNWNTDTEVLDRLADMNDGYINKMISANINASEKVLFKVFKNEGPNRNMVLNIRATSALLFEIAKTGCFRDDIALVEKGDQDLFYYLACCDDPTERIRFNLAGNRNVKYETLLKIFNEAYMDAYYLKELFYNPTFMSNYLRGLYDDEAIAKEVVKLFNLYGYILTTEDYVYDLVKLLETRDYILPIKMESIFISSYKDEAIRYVARNSKNPVILKVLCRSMCAFLSLAENPNVTLDMLKYILDYVKSHNDDGIKEGITFDEMKAAIKKSPAIKSKFDLFDVTHFYKNVLWHDLA